VCFKEREKERERERKREIEKEKERENVYMCDRERWKNMCVCELMCACVA
jgi:hypothetical protein